MGSCIGISFTGNKDKNLNQFISYAPENKSFKLDSMYGIGGLGNVQQEAPENWAKIYKDAGIDVRTVSPYHSYNNPNGKIKVFKGFNAENNPIIGDANVNDKLQKGEHFVIADAPSLDGKVGYLILKETGVSGSIRNINANFEMEDIPYKLFTVGAIFKQGENTPIKVFTAGAPGEPTHYIIHTPMAAKFPKAYDKAGAYGGGDMAYAEAFRAFTDALPKLNNEEHGNFNPANMWFHDRPAFFAVADICERSANGEEYFNGLKLDSRFHNPGRTYQGHTNEALYFFKLIGSEKDYNKLKENQEDYNFLKTINQKIETARNAHQEMRNKITSAAEKAKIPEIKPLLEIIKPEDVKRIDDIFEPLIGNFKDEYGTYNVSEIPIQAKKINAFNTSAGTVSCNYGKEMENLNTPEVADGLTGHLAGIKTINIVNGSTPSNMHTDIKGDFGKPGNGLNAPELKDKFTPFKIENNDKGYGIKNIDEIYSAKIKNTEWLTNAVAKATSEGGDALQKLFFTPTQITPGNGASPSTVLGGLSEYKPGDILHSTWGRPDPQKDLPTLFEAYLHFIQREDVPKEEKLKVKILGGAGVWAEDAPDWARIKELFTQIAAVDGGAYKNNACYGNGYFPNRLSIACTGGDFPSDYEPCGITPFESFAAGNPVNSIKTGGAPDFINAIDIEELRRLRQLRDNGGPEEAEAVRNYLHGKTGFLTKHAFLVRPEVLGIDPAKLEVVPEAEAGKEAIKITDDIRATNLRNERRHVLAAEFSDVLKDFSELHKDQTDVKQVMENVLLEKTDWHENHKYNGGKSANQRYFNEVFGITEDFKTIEPRNTKPLNNLKGKFRDYSTQVKVAAESTGTTIRTIIQKGFFKTTTGKITAITLAVAALTAISTLGYKRKENPTGDRFSLTGTNKKQEARSLVTEV